MHKLIGGILALVGIGLMLKPEPAKAAPKTEEKKPEAKPEEKKPEAKPEEVKK